MQGGRPKAALVGSRSSGLRRAAEGRSWLHWLLVDACAYLPRPSFSFLLYPFHWPLLAPTHSFIYILKSDLSSSPQPYTKYIFSDRILDAFYHHPTPKRDPWIAHWNRKGPMESRKLSRGIQQGVKTEPKTIAMHPTCWSFAGGRRPLRNTGLAGGRGRLYSIVLAGGRRPPWITLRLDGRSKVVCACSLLILFLPVVSPLYIPSNSATASRSNKQRTFVFRLRWARLWRALISSIYIYIYIYKK